MEKITVKDLIRFRGKNDRTKITLVKNLNKEKVKSADGSGGDYWISCLSAIRNTFKYGNVNLLDEKIELLEDKIRVEIDKKNKDQFQKNLDIVNNFKDYDFQHLKPIGDLVFLIQQKDRSIINIKGFPIESKPCHIFTFSNNKSEEIAGVWFVAQKEGFTKNELGMFADMIYRYLDKHYSKDFYVNPDYCIAVDLFNGQELSYSEIQNGKVPVLIDSTLDDLKEF
ncbi:hypothetical protein B4N84_19375 [Flavobacterium sp. IR1]|nr:hypothetical protein B4N84_19375 [Flavobacterium sp. IR1]